jgi:hypothetical protein
MSKHIRNREPDEPVREERSREFRRWCHNDARHRIRRREEAKAAAKQRGAQ